jgi:hypothetical protein
MQLCRIVDWRALLSGLVAPTAISLCWDRWLRDCPRALDEVLAFHKRMHDRANSSEAAVHGTVVARLVDLCDGEIYREHPVLGDAARRSLPTHERLNPEDPQSPFVPRRLPLSIVLYYDDVECAQPCT